MFINTSINKSFVDFKIYEGKSIGRRIFYDNEAANDIERVGAICFADVPNLCLRDEKFNRITLQLKLRQLEKELGKYRISIPVKKYIKSWFASAKKAKLLPHYVNIRSSIKNDRITFDLKRHAFNEIYIYLTLARIPNEHTTVFINTVRLVNEGIDFGPSIMVAMAVGNVHNSNHMFVPPKCCQYFFRPSFKLQLKHIATLAVLSKAVQKYMASNISGITRFNCNDTFDVISRNIPSLSTMVCNKCIENKDELNNIYRYYQRNWYKYTHGLLKADKISTIQRKNGGKK